MDHQKATFAGGCFWCTQAAFAHLSGVQETRAGYLGGHKKNPTYEDVCSGTSGHAEALEIIFDPAQVSYQELLEIFWQNIDPTQENQQFHDQGDQYRTAIFYHDETQKRLAEASKEALEKSERFSRPIVTEIVPAGEFYPAEDYHQEYYKKNPLRYNFYHVASGREEYKKRMWGISK